jgi:carotenoid cleavage dioxygenase-like enzyme
LCQQWPFQPFHFQSANHWFDGLSILTSFTIGHGAVKLTKRYLKSDAFTKAMDNGKFIITEYATSGSTDPSKSAVSKLVRFPSAPSAIKT